MCLASDPREIFETRNKNPRLWFIRAICRPNAVRLSKIETIPGNIYSGTSTGTIREYHGMCILQEKVRKK